MESGLPQQTPPNNQTGGKEDTDDAKQIPTPQKNNLHHSLFSFGWFDDWFKFLESIAFVCWMCHDFFSDEHKIFLFLSIVFGLAGAFYILAHKIIARCAVIQILCWMIFIGCVFFSYRNWPQSTDESKPTLSKNILTLGDGTYGIQNDVTIFNPSDFPVYDTELEILIEGKGVRADSVNLKMTDEDVISEKFPVGDQTIYSDAYTIRCDYMTEPTNQNILFVIGGIPAHGHRYFQIGGTSAINSSAKIEIKDYSTNAPQILTLGSSNILSSPIWKMNGVGMWVSNSSGIGLVITNLVSKPIEQNGKWRHIRFENY